jgi:inorganic pyrophosphatase
MIKVLVEAEAGSRNKKQYDEKTLEFKGTSQISRPYPYPYGFIIGTSAADGDCVDCYLITNDPLMVGTIVECEPIGMLEQIEDGEIDHKVLASLPGQEVTLSQELLEELREFIYAVFAQFPEVSVKIGHILPREPALQHIQKFQDR